MLRVLVAHFPNDFIFKGGTSLSKGYGIVERFSEDVDVLVLPGDRERGAVDKLMKAIGETAAAGVGGQASAWTIPYSPVSRVSRTFADKLMTRTRGVSTAGPSCRMQELRPRRGSQLAGLLADTPLKSPLVISCHHLSSAIGDETMAPIVDVTATQRRAPWPRCSAS